MIIFEYENHIEIFQMKLHTLEMNQFHIFEGDHKWRLWKTALLKNSRKGGRKTNPVGEIDQTARCWL